MSHLLELLGRGLISHLVGAFDAVLETNTDESIEELARSAARRPDDLGIQTRLGGRYLRSDQPTEAAEIFEAVLEKSARHLPARLGMACAMDALGRTSEALEHLRAAQKVDPVSPAILFCLGYCHERQGGEIEAVRYYQEAIGFCPTLRNAHERLAAMYLKEGRTDLAIEHYQTLCELDPHHTDLQLTLANLLLTSGQHREAIRRFEHALSLEPDNWTAHNDIVSAYEEAGLIREAIEHLHKMMQEQPDFPDTRLRLGDLYARVGNDTAATAQYEQAAEMCPDYLEANVKLGTQHLRAGRYADAAKWFSLALEINDRLLSAYVGIGVAQYAEGLRTEALASFEMARNIEPNSTLLFSEVARMHLKSAASEQADLYLPGSKAAGEGRAPAGAQRADLLSEQIERLREAVRQSPNHADLHYRLGLLLRNRGQLEDAIESFKQAVAINPSYVKALIKLGLALGEAERSDEAIAALRQATEIRPDYLDLHYQLGLLFAQRHQFEIAVEHFERAVEGNSGNVAFQANLALALQNMGLIDRAQATWHIVAEASPDSEYGEQARAALAQGPSEE